MKNKKRTIILGALLCLVVVLVGMHIAVSSYMRDYRIANRVSIDHVAVGNMTKDEAKEKLEAYVENVNDAQITLKAGTKEKEISVQRMGITFDINKAINEAYGMGRNGNIVSNFITVCKLKKNVQDIKLESKITKEQAKKVLEKNEKYLILKTQNASLERKNGEFKVIKEVAGHKIVYDKSIQKIQDQISQTWKKGNDTIKISVKKQEPEYKEADMAAVTDVLGTYSTSYGASAYGRARNVENGCARINGTVLYPGDTMSVYEKVSPFDAQHGYHLAPSYASGEVVQTYGGGICQVSTTLYDAVLRAELKVKQRSNHSMTVHYVPLAADAAIAGTEKDFKFVNNQKTPIYIEGKTSGGMITFTIYGKETREKERTISFESKTLSVKSPTVKEIKDKNLELGKRVVEKAGTTGYVAELWKIIYKNGKEVKRLKVNTSHYNSTPSVVRVGTKKPEPKEDATTEEGQGTTEVKKPGSTTARGQQQ